MVSKVEVEVEVEVETKDEYKKETILNKIYREFNHLKLSYKDFEKLNKNFTKIQIDNVLDKIENYKQNKKYNSLYLTANNWLKKEIPIVNEQKDELLLNAVNTN